MRNKTNTYRILNHVAGRRHHRDDRCGGEINQ
jgi:hypothetical protein